MNAPYIVRKCLVCSVLLFLFLFVFYSPAFAADQENCSLCHQYPLLGVVDDNGTFRSFYVDKELYAASMHAQIRCSECHKGITKLPHEKGTVVDCTVACHLIEPTSGRQFTHMGAENVIQASIHGGGNSFVRDPDKEAHKDDFPACLSCHMNEKFSFQLEFGEGFEDFIIAQSKGRCEECHLDRYNYINKNIVHVLRRSDKSRNQQKIEDMCIKCHNDAELNERHSLINAIFSYRQNYHGKTMILGLKTAPACIDCHVNAGDSPHRILSKRDPGSATHPDNRGKMCARIDCHPGASLGMGRSDIHWVLDMSKFPVHFWLMVFFTILTVGSFVSLMVILCMEMFRMIFPKFVIFDLFRRQK
jgi:hypothetical protein